jgi:glyoxylase I family protein
MTSLVATDSRQRDDNDHFAKVQLMAEDVEASDSAPITGLSHVQLSVSDLERSAAWYRAVLGLEGFAADDSVGYVALRQRTAKLVVVLSLDPSESERPIGKGRLDHLAFAVPDGTALSVWADHLSVLGIEHPGVVLENGNPSLQLVDPDGIEIELVAPTHRT